MAPPAVIVPTLSLDKSLNGYLKISDITTYTVGQRDLWGVMMFWSTDDFAADFNMDQSNGSEWTVPALAQDTYNVKGIFVYAWDVLNDVDISQGGIVWWNGLFYILIADATTNPHDYFANNPAIDTETWAPFYVGASFQINMTVYTDITASQVYTLAVASSPKDTGTQVTFIDADSFVLTKTDCLKWNVHINISKNIAQVRLINYDGTILSTITDFSATDIPIDLTEFGDGSYQVEVAYVSQIGDIGTPTNWILVYLPILEVCQANNCYQKLFRYTLCKCDNPCDDCDDNKARLHDMRMIRELITTINQMVSLDRSIFVGIYPVSTTQADLLTDIGQMIDKLKLITDRCGLCSEGNNDLNCD